MIFPSQSAIAYFASAQVDARKWSGSISGKKAGEKAKQKVLRVYSVTLRTAEGPNVKQAPPFREITVGDSYYIRPAAVK